MSEEKKKVFEIQSILDTENPLLIHHRVRGRGIYPAVGYLNLVVEALQEHCRDVSLQGRFLFKNVSWHQPVVLASRETQRPLTIRLERGERAVDFSISSSIDGERMVHASGIVEWDTQTPEGDGLPEGDLGAEDAGDTMDAAALYPLFDQIGISYHGMFQALRKLTFFPGGTAGIIEVKDGERYMAHPGVLDACLQAVLMTVFRRVEHSGVYVPFSMRAMTVARLPLDTAYEVEVRPRDIQAAEGFGRFDLALKDRDGALLVRIDDLGVKAYASTLPIAVSAKEQAGMAELRAELATLALSI